MSTPAERHPDLLEARAHMQNVQSWLAFVRARYGKGAPVVLQHERQFCRALDYLWRVQDRLGLNDGKV